ncbi:aminoglycoside adenylyltransferase domain-containing protein [Paenibacillus endoradicis]|uniref:aminoglycoside adenylyltransferase domain-containing protein n=1 Tax=Paenibacillus endoradicis TaxID=2972487 RepID=UPI002158AF4D|nr:aminoglycoside adenylyltransferase domain-containing protein [Paenibacillus endoradicis]MCR8656637.1 DUF4111 domain-containing protein [Paenibacillus endoradicis]
MSPNLHPRIIEIIDLYLHEIQQLNFNLINGFYIYGSISMGDYSLELSDIDFIAISDERLSKSDIERCNQIHRKIESKYKKPNLNGIYITWNDLGKLPEEVEPFPYYSDGHMHECGYFEMNLVTWYELKHFGINVIGPATKELDFSVDWELLITKMHENLNTYWNNWIKKSSDWRSLYSYLLYFRVSEIEWGVLGITRLYYTFREQKITTKVRAGEYALNVVPIQFHKIINESIHTRRSISKSLYRSNIRRKHEAINYMNYIMNEINKESR